MEKLYSCGEVAQRYGVRVSTVWSWLRRNKLGAVKIGKLYRIRESDIVKFEKGE